MRQLHGDLLTANTIYDRPFCFCIAIESSEMKRSNGPGGWSAAAAILPLEAFTP